MAFGEWHYVEACDEQHRIAMLCVRRKGHTYECSELAAMDRVFNAGVALAVEAIGQKGGAQKVCAVSITGTSVKILEYSREHGRVTIGDISELTGVNRSSLKKHFSHRVEKGHLVLNGKGRGAWLLSPIRSLILHFTPAPEFVVVIQQVQVRC